jgi:hypothetical protein
MTQRDFLYRKEVHFFDVQGRHRRGSSPLTPNDFTTCKSTDGTTGTTSLAMDATPEYLLYPTEAPSFQNDQRDGNGRAAKNLKILLTLRRDPVARELSLYNHKKSTSNLLIKRLDGSVLSFDGYVDLLLVPFSNGNKDWKGFCGRDDGFYSKHLLPTWFEQQLFDRN